MKETLDLVTHLNECSVLRKDDAGSITESTIFGGCGNPTNVPIFFHTMEEAGSEYPEH